MEIFQVISEKAFNSDNCSYSELRRQIGDSKLSQRLSIVKMILFLYLERLEDKLLLSETSHQCHWTETRTSLGKERSWDHGKMSLEVL